MKNIHKFLSMLAFIAIMSACNEKLFDDISFLETASSPAKMSALFDITQDNTGLVTITPNGEGVATFSVNFGDGTTTPATVDAGKSVQHKYAEGIYSVKLVGKGVTGKVSESTQELTVSFKAPENVEVNSTIDPANPFKVNVSAKAINETLFKVYFGDVANEVPVSFLEGATVSHTYTAVGTYEMKVVALSGGKATTEVKKTINIVSPVVLPLDFETAGQTYKFSNFEGGDVSVIANPQVSGINTSSKVAKMVKNPGQTYGGSLITLGSSMDFSVNKYFSMKVFSPRVGAKVLLKVENASNGSQSFEKEVTTSKANVWEELIFDFSAINTANSYQNVVLIFDNGTRGDGSANFTFLFDDIKLMNPIVIAPINLPVTFDEANTNYSVTDFGNNSTIDGVDPINASNKVKITTKPSGAETWAGTTIGTPTGFASAIKLTASNPKMSVRVYSPAAGIPIRLKIEDRNNANISVETEVLTKSAKAWEELTFDFTKQVAGTSALNLSNTYHKASLFFDFGTAGNGKVFYWDDVKIAAVTETNNSLTIPLTFESTSLKYDFLNFDGGNANVITNPQVNGINTSSKVVQMIKNGGQPWGGAFITLEKTIDFSVSKTFKMKVFAPKVGTKVLLKVENLTDGGVSFEKELSTTKANAWEELTFDFSGIDVSKSYQKVVLIFDNGTKGDGSANFTYLFDDIILY